MKQMNSRHYPRLINTWLDDYKWTRSPGRISYGVHNPAARGIILTHDTVIPNFSFTPRLALPANPRDVLAEWLNATEDDDNENDDVLLLPAVTGMVVRLFYWAGVWHLASNEVLECIYTASYPWPLTRIFQSCILPHVPGGIGDFLLTLEQSCYEAMTLVWFFALYPERPGLLFLGTCQTVEGTDDWVKPIDFHFMHATPRLDQVPALPSVSSVDFLDRHVFYDDSTLRYTDLYNGLLLMNRRTLFAARLCTAQCLFLQPVLDRELDVPEFIVLRKIQSMFHDMERIECDIQTRNWFVVIIPAFLEKMFGPRHATFLQLVVNHLGSLTSWLPQLAIWFWQTGQWRAHPEVGHLLSVLEYEESVRWVMILQNPKYHRALTRALLLSMAFLNL